MDIWHLIADRKIREAMEEGAFDNLEGKGRPLDLCEDPFVDPSLQLAHRLLKNNGFAPGWIEEHKAIETAIAELRGALRASHPDLARIRAAAREINRRIARYNLIAPSVAVQKLPLELESEIAASAPL